MNRINIVVIVSLFLISCNLGEKLEQMQKMNDDLEQHFQHHHINMIIGFGTNEEDNNIEVTFYEYDLASIDYKELKRLSEKVAKRLNSKYPNFRNKSYIEIRFTEESKSDDNSSFVSFKHSN